MLFSTAAIAGSDGGKTGVDSAPLGVASKTSNFLTAAAASGMTQIGAAKILFGRATRRKSGSSIRWCATSQTSEELKGLVSSGGVKATLPCDVARFVAEN